MKTLGILFCVCFEVYFKFSIVRRPKGSLQQKAWPLTEQTPQPTALSTM